MSFVHLHVHSEYSLLDGFSNIKKLVQRAVEMGMPAVGLTDHGAMFGVIDFYKAATAAGIKPIVGVEIYLAARGMRERDPQFDKKSSHLLLLAENETGYKNLLQIASAAQLEGFYYYPRIDHDFLATHSEGLICTSGCMAAEIPRLIQQENLDAARRQLDWYFQVFGPDNFFLELQSHNIQELERINKILLDLGARYPGRFLATNDVHYINPEDARLQDIMLAIQTGCVLNDPNRMRMSDNTYYFRSPEEMASIFANIPTALSNTLLIAERCNVDLGFKGYHLPEFSVPEGQTAENYLRSLCEEGLQKRYGDRVHDPVVRQRLEYELGIIHQMGFDTYFLIVWDLCRYAREQGIWYNARGSAAGSIVAYSLDITLVDPIEHGLIFERFLNPGRISMPDIDLDFRDDRRADMLEYTAHKYGNDKVAQIITFGTLGARAAIRDVGRVMDIPLSEVDKVAKLIPNIPGKPVSVQQVLEEIPEFKSLYESEDYLKELVDTASQVEGVVRNAGTHAAGVIITDKPLVEYIPLHRPTGSSAEDSPVKTVTQFEMSILESLGLLKVDFLGLATLTIMARACDLIRQRHGIDFTLQNIPTEDPETYELLGRGETAGVFQVEGSGMRRWLMQMKPKSLDNVIAMVALFRPGPMDFIPSYISRMHGEEEITYRHPDLKPILEETYGITVYQEQIMYTAMNLAGYTASEADNLRKGVAKKQAELLLQHRQKFTEGAIANGISAEIANLIFDDWEAFARYGFPKGHAADYGVLAVQTAYLKCHYSVEYMTALLSVSLAEMEKVALYAADCRRMGIEVLPPDVNFSNWDFSIQDNAQGGAYIRFGLGAVKNVGHGPVNTILEARQNGEPFDNINSFARRVDLRAVGKRSLESLIRVGALDSFGTRPALLAALDRILSISSSHFRAADMGQMSLFGVHTGLTEEIVLPKIAAEVSRREVLSWERELIGLYVSDHPLSSVMDLLNQAVSHFSGQLAEATTNERVRVAGLVARVRPHMTKSGKPMGFATLEDIQGNIELVIFPKTWEKYGSLLEHEHIVLVEGRVDAESGDPKVLVDSISTELTTYEASPARPTSADEYFFYGEDNEAEERQAKQNSNTTQANPAPTPVETPHLADTLPAITQPPVEAQASLPQVKEPPEPHTQAPGAPPPPEAFPPDWNSFEVVPNGFVVETGSQAAANKTTEPILEAEKRNEPGDKQASLAQAGAAEAAEPAQPGDSRSTPAAIPAAMPRESSTPAASPAQETLEVNPHKLAAPPAYPGESKEHPGEAEAEEAPKIFTPYILSPIPRADSEEIHIITVILRPTGDKVRDNLRLRQAYGQLITYPGNDHFALLVFERGRGYQIEFPNFTTGLNNELLLRLNKLVGAENVRIELLRIQ